MIKFQQFQEVDLRLGKVLSAEAHPNADKLVVLHVDLGSEHRQLVAGIREYYKPEELVGRTIVVVANLEPAKLRGVWSQGMLLAGVEGEGGRVAILTCDKDLAPGTKVS